LTGRPDLVGKNIITGLVFNQIDPYEIVQFS